MTSALVLTNKIPISRNPSRRLYSLQIAATRVVPLIPRLQIPIKPLTPTSLLIPAIKPELEGHLKLKEYFHVMFTVACARLLDMT
ncbi:hypothetical protein E2562_031724 [Oryza meyeriana var. granulata]|uniref:Uncharacterized protein n=1 Tax=Oryza meyeriana var. granulata TaxID=110450 RepID=A0A6G1FEG9_9ORYZ|nr:hypothetical protein E2562_031724 [Oryza meyeriana var. granulata]